MNVDLRGPAGLLEALLDEPSPPARELAAVVCHPHPLFGGTMRNIVTHRIARGLAAAGMTVLRFNFRGAGRSAGQHDEGKGEVDDLRASVAWLLDRVPEAQLILAGYSFGARVSSLLFPEENRAKALVLVGPPVRLGSFDHLVTTPKPKYLLVAEHDEFGPPSDVQSFFDRLSPPKRLHLLSGTDHGFASRLRELEQIVREIGLEQSAETQRVADA